MFPSVQPSAEYNRIAALPTRVWTADQLTDLAGRLTSYYKTARGTMKLFPIQAHMLADAAEVGGLFAQVRVGGGKTLASFLVPRVLDAQRPVLFVPANLRDKTERDMRDMARHWAVHPRITVVSYEQLSRADASDLLERLNPDLILADECHKFRHRRTARTRRFLRYMHDREKTGTPVKFACFSGSQFRRQLREFWHLIGLALPDDAPIPYHWPTMEEWGLALDAKVDSWKRPRPGVLLDFARPEDVVEGDELATARKGYGRRLTSTWGVVASSEAELGCSLQLIERKPEVPAVIQDALANLSATWETPNGDELEWAPAVWRIARELACGMFYRWSPAPPASWLEPRRAWNKFVRGILKSSTPGLDSPLQVACEYRDHPLHEAWVAVRDQYDPEEHKVAVWLDDFMVRDAQVWLAESKTPGIIWVEHGAVGRAISAATGLRYFAGGERDSIDINDATGSFIASIKAHGTGKNLQRYSRALITSVPPSNDVWEQLIGRLHRTGQEADEVTFDFYLHARELRDGFLDALDEAKLVELVTGQPQKLRFADLITKPTVS